MTHRRQLLGLLFVGLAVVLGTGWWWLSRPHTPPFKIVLKGSSGYSGNLGVSGGNLFVVAPKPGTFFGTVRKPDGQEQFTYLILFRYGLPKSDGTNRGLQFSCTSDGNNAETKNAIELDGKRIEAVYRIELNETRTAVENESLTIGGESVDITSGQVFLIDLSDESPVYRQKKLELPAISSKLESPQDVERLAETIRKSLESQDPEIKAFLQ
jgi:hypothetical protein